MGDHSHHPDLPLTQKRNDGASDDARESHRVASNPKAGKSAVEKTPPPDDQDQIAIEEFDREGMGVAPKE